MTKHLAGADIDIRAMRKRFYFLTQTRKSGSFICGYAAGIHLRDMILLPQNQKEKTNEIPSNGGLYRRTRCAENCYFDKISEKNDTVGNVNFWGEGMGKKGFLASETRRKSGTKRPP